MMYPFMTLNDDTEITILKCGQMAGLKLYRNTR